MLKSVPWGAGMGGGSSDAATVLLALNRLWNLNLPRARLLELATPLGADVPFFVGGDNAFVEGIGEQLTPVHWAPRRYAVVKPAESLGTRRHLFSSGLGTRHGSCYSSRLSCTHECRARSGMYGHNDLQPIAQGLMPGHRPGRTMAGKQIRQQPDDRIGQCGVRESRCRRRVVARG